MVVQRQQPQARKNRPFLLWATVLACTTLGVSCVHGNVDEGIADGAPDEGQVVERSKARPPEWLALTPGVLNEVGTELRMVTKRSKLLNLKLGLTQTQTAAVDAMRLAIAARVQAQLAEIAPTSPPDTVRAWQRMVFDTTLAVTPQAISVKDVYFEAVQRHLGGAANGLSYYHAVSIVTVCPKDQILAIYQELERRLQAAKQPHWQQMAVRLRQVTAQSKQ